MSPFLQYFQSLLTKVVPDPFYGWNQDTSMNDLLSCLREDSLTDVSTCSLTEFPNVYEVDQPYRGTAVASSLDQQNQVEHYPRSPAMSSATMRRAS